MNAHAGEPPAAPPPSDSQPLTSLPAAMLSKFNQTLRLPALRVPTSLLGSVLPTLKKANVLYKHPKVRNVQDDGSKAVGSKLLLLDGKCTSGEQQALHAAVQQLLEQHHDELQLTQYEIQQSYGQSTSDEALRMLLPPAIAAISSFETIGHVIHLNLNDQQYPYRHTIGRVLLDKNRPTIETVVTKVGTIDSQFRTYECELIAGEPKYEVVVREHGYQYQLDIRHVYWNSRLSTEHQRVASLFNTNDTVIDLCCGIGPFVIPAAASKQCTVYANDLNPKSIEYLHKNIALNRISGEKLHVTNLDGRQCMQQFAADQLSSQINVAPSSTIHVMMNLPSLSVSLMLPAFNGLYNNQLVQETTEATIAAIRSNLPIVHCHCFVNANDPVDDALQQISAVLDYKFSNIVLNNAIKHSADGTAETTVIATLHRAHKPVNVKQSKKQSATTKIQFDNHNYADMQAGTIVLHNVRNVSPNKDMLCVSFRLPAEVAFRDKPSITSSVSDGSIVNNVAEREPAVKRVKLSAEDG